jgi:Cof subfamily protein (haloacid dehalogenase superfamily)
MCVELVALDLDGTLLESDGSLPSRNAVAIAAVQAQGVGVILATGKTLWAAVDLIAELKLTLPSVFSQGLIVSEADGTILREMVLDYDLVNRVLSYLEQQRLPYIAYSRNGLLTPESDPYNDPITGKYREPEPHVMGFMAGRAEELQINKLLIGDRYDLPRRCLDLERRFGHEAKVMHAVPEYVDMIPPGTSKGAGVRWLLERLQIDPSRMLAMGDGDNDIEMLEMAGIGVAMNNGSARLKSVANYIVSNDDDTGVAAALERFVLH